MLARVFEMVYFEMEGVYWIGGGREGFLCGVYHCRRVVCAVFGAVGFSKKYKSKKQQVET